MTTLTTISAVETPNLVIREIRTRDAAHMATFLTQARYHKHITHRLRSEDAVQDFVRRQVAAQGDARRQVFHLAAEEKLSGEVIGEGFIIVHPSQGHEIGWGVHPAMWSMGLGTEIARAVLALGFERMGAATMWCKVMAANGASMSVARRVGMKEISSHPDYAVGQGRFETIHVFSLSMPDYFELPY